RSVPARVRARAAQAELLESLRPERRPLAELLERPTTSSWHRSDEEAHRAYAGKLASGREVAVSLGGGFPAGAPTVVLAAPLAPLDVLDRIAASVEPVLVRVRLFAGERRALRGFGGNPRCVFSHDAITGDEPDLDACEQCHTVFHDACWVDLGWCPILECGNH